MNKKTLILTAILVLMALGLLLGLSLMTNSMIEAQFQRQVRVTVSPDLYDDY